MNRYPLGIQTFEKIREENLFYVDKTDLIYNIVKGSQNNFLSRPRRFGKSLLVTTMQAYFEGKKDLFKGLAIEKLEKEWVKYPVIHIDLSSGKYYEVQRIMSTLDFLLSRYELKYDITPRDLSGFGDRFNNIIQTAAAQTGQKVVVLIDEGLLRFVFLTGITKFSQLSIFSELNNIKNYSLDDEYGAICGFTQEEILSTFHEGIHEMAKANGLTIEQTVAKMKEQYDGYRFTPHCPNIYNPYSVLNALHDKKFSNYWFATGTPTFLLELLIKNDIEMPQLEGIVATEDQFDSPTDNIGNPIPVLYQSGYLTIKDYDEGIYTLGYPNEEVRMGLNRSMLNYIAPQYGLKTTAFAAQFRAAMRKDDIDTAMKVLQSFLAAFPYDIHHNREDYFQAILFTIFITLGFTIHAEVKTARGRIDLLISTKTTIFVMELKIDQSAAKALEQIDAKDYTLPYKHDGRRIFKVGINFSTEKRTVDEWRYEEA